jgi:hypothetical protein
LWDVGWRRPRPLLVRDQAYLGTNSQTGTSVFDNNVTQSNFPRTLQFSLRLLF